MIRYYFRITDKCGHLTNDYITVVATDLKAARKIATAHVKEQGIKYRMTPILEEPIEDEQISNEDIKEPDPFENGPFTPKEVFYIKYYATLAALAYAGWWLSQHFSYFSYNL